MQQTSHALVIGGSMAGLLTGRILANHFDQVTIIERDYYPTEPSPRPGIPQSGHLHLLLSQGRIILEQLFPGVQAELLAAGATLLTSDSKWYSPAGWAPRLTPDSHSFICSRSLLDWTIHRRLAAFEKVRFLEGGTVKGLLANSDQTNVTGVTVRFRDQAGNIHQENLCADLVIDASGKVSQAPQWLEALGYVAPKVSVINGFVGYATRIYQAQDNHQADWQSIFISTSPPSRTRGAGIFPIEGKRWIVSLGGGDRDYPPTNEAGFLEFARSLPTPLIYNAIKDAQPLTPIYSYRGTENRMRHYESLSRQPENLIVVGHAACAFNPVYGQGMTVAALSAQILDKCLTQQRQKSTDGNLDGLARQVQRQLAKVHDVAWLFATSQDCRYSGSVGGKQNFVTQIMIQYMDQVLKLVTEDEEICQTFLEVVHMLKPSSALFHPKIFVKAIGQIFKPASTKPAEIFDVATFSK